MFNLFSTPHEELDSKINNLEDKINQSQQLFRATLSRSEWDEIFQLCAEIAESFKKVRYPNREQRDIAWQKFFNLRDKAFKVKNASLHDQSKSHYNDLMRELAACDYDSLADNLVGRIMSLGLLATTAEEMKQNARDLNKASSHFKEVKHEMISEHKTEVHERILQVRRHHDDFWGQYKSYQEEKSHLYEEKKRNWEEKQQKSKEVRESIERNIESNEGKLSRAQDALRRFESKRDDLKDKIYDSHSDNWKEKAEVWLDEFEDKIKDIEEQIERIEGWIREGRDKLANWN